jgi:hypothetical protein
MAEVGLTTVQGLPAMVEAARLPSDRIAASISNALRLDFQTVPRHHWSIRSWCYLAASDGGTELSLRGPRTVRWLIG